MDRLRYIPIVALLKGHRYEQICRWHGRRIVSALDLGVHRHNAEQE